MYTLPTAYRCDGLLGALGAAPSTWDFVLSQCSGNTALLIWMLANAVWASGHISHEKSQESEEL